MGFMNYLTRQNKSRVSPNSSFVLTDRGEAYLTDRDCGGTKAESVLVTLETMGTSANADSICGQARLPRRQVDKYLDTLLQRGLIRDVSKREEEDG